MISSPPVQLEALPEAAWAIARRISQALRPDAIYLFGSHARGEAGPNSDLDFLVVIPESTHTRYTRSVEARRLVGDIHAPKDIVVLTRQEWEAEQRVVCSLSSTVLREGIRLHG
jgi:predicted nucleotidyltransferase